MLKGLPDRGCMFYAAFDLFELYWTLSLHLMQYINKLEVLLKKYNPLLTAVNVRRIQKNNLF